jgi:hypothetical protein
MLKRMMIQRRYLLARNSLANTEDFAVVDFEQQHNTVQNKHINDKPPSYETVTEQDKMLPKYEEL